MASRCLTLLWGHFRLEQSIGAEPCKKTMRLNDKTREIIKSEVASQLGPDAVVRLFGSRVDDTQRGGDIDLLIEPGHPIEHRVQAECKLSARLFIKLGGCKVDVLIKDQTMPSQPIHRLATDQGIVL